MGGLLTYPGKPGGRLMRGRGNFRGLMMELTTCCQSTTNTSVNRERVDRNLLKNACRRRRFLNVRSPSLMRIDDFARF